MAGGSQPDGELITQINVTPLVDIILVLLIIFMVTTEVIHDAERPSVIPLNLPEAASAEEMLSRGLLSLVIDRHGTLYVNNTESTFEALDLTIEKLKAGPAKPQAIISADQSISHGEVAGLMDFLRLRGVLQIALNTKKQTIE
ncbi:MAG: biopolymer transport protein ExbD [Myxococcota bacterium]|jgi:biopolymer transport protein ExbD